MAMSSPQAIVQSGIPIHVRKDLPEHLIPPDSRVEIDAKIAAGCTDSLVPKALCR